MDELQMLANLLARPDQSDDAVEHGRCQLKKAMHDPFLRRRRTGRLAGVLGLTAAAAVAVAVASSTTAPAPAPSRSSAAAPQNAREILLTAAMAALKEPASTGKYWYVKTVYTKDGSAGYSVETWAGLDGKSWVRLNSPSGAAVSNEGSNGHWSDGFDVGLTRLTFSQVQQLPTAPVTLKAWIVEHDHQARWVVEHGHQALKTDFLIGDLAGLLGSMPAPPLVRAAAFRLLASLPGVRSLGPVKGGQALLLPDPGGHSILVINLGTSQVHGLVSDVTDGQKIYGSYAVVEAEWTNALPSR
jgi:hypothetical protein